jgi:hypothetical protein
MRAQHVLLSRRCPVCGGRSGAEGKLPLSQGMRTMELNLDEPARLIETLSLHLLLALVELIPYKQFACQRCGHEFRLASQTSREMLYAMLVSMQPVAPPSAPAKTPVNAPPAPARQVAQKPKGMPAALTPQALAAPKGKAKSRVGVQEPKPVPGKQMPPDWQPYHLDSDMDALFDQFKEE